MKASEECLTVPQQSNIATRPLVFDFSVQLHGEAQFLQRNANVVQGCGNIDGSSRFDGLSNTRRSPGGARLEYPDRGAQQPASARVVLCRVVAFHVLCRALNAARDLLKLPFRERFGQPLARGFLFLLKRGLQGLQGTFRVAAIPLEFLHETYQHIQIADRPEPFCDLPEPAVQLARRVTVESQHRK